MLLKIINHSVKIIEAMNFFNFFLPVEVLNQKHTKSSQKESISERISSVKLNELK